MSAEILRRAAVEIRSDYYGDDEFMNAVADWLDSEAGSWASDPDDTDGLTYFHAYIVANAYLGGAR